MAFSDGQLLFAAIFLVFFIVFMVFAYRKDFKISSWYTKGAWKVLLIVIGIFAFFYLVVRLLGTS
ncbi:MAG: hypothetical protein CL843_12685 [Crocinitomicaceae bacterium]|nr:hypothetical protein [Crocinitomicaceae bacterium]|tara:strand:- start:36 stop:230 length:195 start_codon:yes stop_codon:yes gene_type:complete